MVGTGEAVIIELLGHPKGQTIRYTVAAGITIEKGTLLQVTTPRTASAATGVQAFGGISAAEKDSADSSTTLGANTYAIYDISGVSCTIGQPVFMSGQVVSGAEQGDGSEVVGSIVGTALETCTAPEKINVLVRRP